jgi:uncharacterized protein (DUF433 family)
MTSTSKIINMLNRGLTAQQVAEDLGCTLAYVIRVIKEEQGND